jgi:DMSO/TMAO reductase YedYZ molybdopterin-dependent catalytic subunit
MGKRLDFDLNMKSRKGFAVYLVLVLMAVMWAACSAQSPTATSTPVEDIATSVTSTPALCPLPTVIAPTPPAVIPGYAKLDETTNLHVTGTMQEIDPAEYRLVVSGAVGNPLSLTYDELRCMPKRAVRTLLVCPGFFQDEATWAGVPLNYVLDMADISPNASDIVLRGADGYTARLELDVIRDGNRHILAYEWQGEPLPALHGFPLRAVLPEQQGNKWVKWLLEIEVRQ